MSDFYQSTITGISARHFTTIDDHSMQQQTIQNRVFQGALQKPYIIEQETLFRQRLS